MSKISKYLQINEYFLLEYTYDTTAKTKSKNRDVTVVKDNSGRLMFFENPLKKTIETDYKKGLMFSCFPDSKTQDSFFYPGHIRIPNSEDAWIDQPTQKLLNQGKISSIIGSSNTVDIPYDTVRIYLATGYTFNDILGFMLNITVKQSAKCLVESENKDVVLANFFFHKGMSSSVIKFAQKPFYQHSRFYDRYIEFSFPSGFYMASHKSKNVTDDNDVTIFDVLGIENGKIVNFNYAYITDESFNRIDYTSNDYVDYFSDSELGFSDRILYNQGNYYISAFLESSITLNSNSDNFNVRLYEDEENNCIRYYPIWGSVIDDMPVTRRIMNSIENGSINLSLKGFLDDRDAALDDFEAIYGEDARKWIVVNQLELTYHYQPVLSTNLPYDKEIVVTRKFNYTEDFEDDVDNYISVDDMYKFIFKPTVETLNNGYVCQYINVTYTARLVNRLNGSEVIRVATLNIDDAESKFGLKSRRIDVRNIYTWKLFNKIESENVQIVAPEMKTNRTKYITKFVDNSMFTMVDEDGISNTQGQFVINLYDTEHIYRMKLYTDPTLQTVFSLSESNASYMMRVTTGSENVPVYLNPTYSANMNSVAGELEFKITEEMAKKIMQGDMRWHIVAKAETGITTLFAGKFKSVFENES